MNIEEVEAAKEYLCGLRRLVTPREPLWALSKDATWKQRRTISKDAIFFAACRLGIRHRTDRNGTLIAVSYKKPRRRKQ